MTDETKDDPQLQREVLQELQWDSRVDPTEIGAEVRDGVVTLSGSVSSWAKKIAAGEAAHRVRGVLDVANELAVRVDGSATPSDSEIAGAVRNALRWDVFVPDDRIYSTVANGVVTLEGDVETYAQREDAERAVRNLAGVRLVFNEIAVASMQITPELLRGAIHDALDRHADRDAQHVQLDIEGGRVTLHGHVHSWREREAIVGAVTGTRGVETVVDRLRVA